MIQVVLQVAYIIARQPLHGVQAGCLSAGITDVRVVFFRHLLPYRQHAFVQQLPQGNQISRLGLLILIGIYPEVLIVYHMRWLRLILSADKPPEVVRSRVDQMPENFLLAPLMRMWFYGEGAVADALEFRGKLVDDDAQFEDNVLHGVKLPLGCGINAEYFGHFIQQGLQVFTMLTPSATIYRCEGMPARQLQLCLTDDFFYAGFPAFG